MPGISTGRWLTDADDLVVSDGGARDGPLALGFPQNWPASFKESVALKKLLKSLKGTRVRAVERDAAAATAAGAAGVPLYPLHSFGNAERLEGALGWAVVKGYIVYERRDQPSGSQYVGVRHWWNQRPDGAWIDLTPVAKSDVDEAGGEKRTLLVETKLGEKLEEVLEDDAFDRAATLCRRLRGLAAAAAGLASASSTVAEPKATGAAPPKPPKPPPKPVIDWGDAPTDLVPSSKPAPPEAPSAEDAPVVRGAALEPAASSLQGSARVKQVASGGRLADTRWAPPRVSSRARVVAPPAASRALRARCCRARHSSRRGSPSCARSCSASATRCAWRRSSRRGSADS